MQDTTQVKFCEFNFAFKIACGLLLFGVYDMFEVLVFQRIVIISRMQDAMASEVLSKVVARRVMPCPICSAAFETNQSLRDHVNGVHLRKKCFRCVDCGEGFMWRAQLSRHQRTPGQCRCANAAQFQFS